MQVLGALALAFLIYGVTNFLKDLSEGLGVFKRRIR